MPKEDEESEPLKVLGEVSKKVDRIADHLLPKPRKDDKEERRTKERRKPRAEEKPKGFWG